MTAQVDNRLRVAAGQLYESQAAKEVKPAKDVAAILRERLDQNNQKAEPRTAVSFVDYTNQAVEAFNIIIDELEDKAYSEDLASFWDKTVDEATDEDKQLVAKSLLSKLLFLVDNEQDVQAILASETPSKGIAEQFAKTVADRLNVTSNVTAIQNVQIGQDKVVVTANLIGREVADLLITSTGFFNSALVADVQSVLSKSYPAMAKVLEGFSQAPELLDDFSDEILADSLLVGLYGNAEDLNAHAKRAVLSACLAVPSSKTIAATSSQVQKEVNLARFVEQLRKIVETAGMVRRLEGQQKKVRLDLDCPAALLNHEFQAATTGEITKNLYYNNNFLWEVAGIKYACCAMKIESKDIKDKVTEALKALGGEKPAARFAVTVAQVIKQLSGNDEELARIGNYAFVSSYSNPLLDAWVRMTDDLLTIREENRHLARLHEAVSSILAPHFKATDATPVAAVKQEKAFAAFRTNLEANLAKALPREAAAFREAVITAVPADAPQAAQIQTTVANKRFLAQIPSWNIRKEATVDDFMQIFTDSAKKNFTVNSAKELATALQAAKKEEIEGKRLMLSSPKATFEYITFGNPNWSQLAKKAYEAQKDAETRVLLTTWIREHVVVEAMRDDFDSLITTMSNDWDHMKWYQELLNRLSNVVLEDLPTAEEAVKAQIFSSQKDELIPFGKTASGDTVGIVWDAYAKTQVVGMISKDALVRLPDDWVAGKWEFSHAPAAAK